MADSSSDDDNEFPSLPPSIMLDLGSQSEDNEHKFRVVSDLTKEEELPPQPCMNVRSDSSSSDSSSDSEDQGENQKTAGDVNIYSNSKRATEKPSKKKTDFKDVFQVVEYGYVPDGAICFACQECTGFQLHSWRRVCNGCKCSKEDHEIKIDELNGNLNNLSIVHDQHQKNYNDEENVLSKYAWVPPGLDDELIESYMRSLPSDKIPHFDNTEGMKYRNKQLVMQFPVQDTKFEECKNLPEKSKYTFDQFVKNREANMATGHVEKAFRIKECNSCHQDISIDSAYVLAFNMGNDAAWHPGCFKCSKCSELLINLVFFQSDGDIHCGRHYAENIKPRCGACDELILYGEYVRASEQNYHIQHFCCWICDAELSGKQHLVESNQPICIECYNRKCANNCYKCKEKISMDDKDILYDNHHWHDTCLICVVCNETLSGRSFLVKDDGDFICSDCHKQADTRRCKTCEKGFEPGMKRLELNGVFWHESCFVCELCKEPISSKRFMRHQDLTVCVKCYEGTFVKKCVVCLKPLTDGGISYNGEPYHKDCFACAKCNASIASKAFSVKDGKNFCVDCYSDMFAKKCKACDDFILTGEYYTLDDDTWHKQCFKCTKCNEPLASTSFVQEGDDILLICESCI